MNSDMIKPITFGHLHLVYHFTVPLRGVPSLITIKEKNFGTLSEWSRDFLDK